MCSISYLLLLLTHFCPSALSLICDFLGRRLVTEIQADDGSRGLLEQEEGGQRLLRRIGIPDLLFAHLTRLTRRVHSRKVAHQGIEGIGVDAGIGAVDHAIGLIHKSLIEILNVTHDRGEAGKNLIKPGLVTRASHIKTNSIGRPGQEEVLHPSRNPGRATGTNDRIWHLRWWKSMSSGGEKAACAYS